MKHVYVLRMKDYFFTYYYIVIRLLFIYFFILHTTPQAFSFKTHRFEIKAY